MEIYLLNPRAKERRALRHTPPSFVEHQEMRDESSSLMGDFLSHRGLEKVSGWEQREEAGPTPSKNDSIYVRAFLLGPYAACWIDLEMLRVGVSELLCILNWSL